MAQYRTFFVPLGDGGEAQEALNAFLRSKRVLGVERVLGREAIKEFVPIQPGDVEATWADTTLLKEAVGYAPSTPLGEGVERFARWFKGYSWR